MIASCYLFRPKNEEDARSIMALRRRFSADSFRLTVATSNEHAGFRRSSCKTWAATSTHSC
jgi:hypothetical protein